MEFSAAEQNAYAKKLVGSRGHVRHLSTDYRTKCFHCDFVNTILRGKPTYQLNLGVYGNQEAV